jgi:hypothetical protein
MERYDPNQAPDPAEWTSLSESQRIALVEDYHRRAGISVPNMRVHAAAHAVIESQAALGDELPVQRAIQRLMDGGLDRHEAVHAVGSVLANTIFEISKDREVSQAAYNAEVEKLTVERWRRYLASEDGNMDDPAPKGPAKRRRLFRG